MTSETERAEAIRARALSDHRVAQDELRAAEAELERAKVALDDQATTEAAEGVEAAERKLRSRVLLVESRAKALEAAEAALANAKRADAREAIRDREAERDRLRHEFLGLLREFERLLASLREAIASVEDLAAREGQLCAEIKRLAITADVVVDAEPRDASALRYLVGAHLARMAGTPAPPEAFTSQDFERALGFVATARGGFVRDRAVEALLQEWIEVASPIAADWLRPIPVPRWDDQTAAANRARRAHRELDELERVQPSPALEETNHGKQV
jgi:chromosome segregation ATPase